MSSSESSIASRWIPKQASQWDADLYLDLYYANFHRAHPFVLPHDLFRRRLTSAAPGTQQLLPTMELVGSFYSSVQPRAALRENAEIALDNGPENGFAVQALLMFAIVLHANNEFIHARSTLDRAIEMALRLRMFSKEFSVQHGNSCKIIEESWRRTWWCLYATDSVFSAIRHAQTFALRNVIADLDLPCEESEYQQGRIPHPRTMNEYNNREFLCEDKAEFSSFAYLIDIAQILGFVLALDRESSDPLQPDVVDAETRLMSWIMCVRLMGGRVFRESIKH